MDGGAQAYPQQMQRLIGTATRGDLSRPVPKGWQPIASAPFGCDPQLGAIENGDALSPLQNGRRRSNNPPQSIETHRFQPDD
jgi:hypothetical protein